MPAVKTKKIETIAEMRAFAAALRAKGKSIGLVPSMGAIHAGQEALIKAASKHADVVVVSIFVNPHAFGPNESYASYPRMPEADFAACERLKVEAVFMPAPEEMFPLGYATYVCEEFVSKPLCGVSRPVYFRGATTHVAKLLNVIRPDAIFLGQKDAQQTAVVRKMTIDLNFEVEIVVVPTVREPDGLAAGVRNREMTPSQRNEALALSKALKKVKDMVEKGVRNPDRLVAEATHVLTQSRRVRVIYVSVVDAATMEPVREITLGKTLLTIAAWVDELRLIDNVML